MTKCPTCGGTGPGARVIAGGCEDAWHYTLPESTLVFELAKEER